MVSSSTKPSASPVSRPVHTTTSIPAYNSITNLTRHTLLRPVHELHFGKEVREGNVYTGCMGIGTWGQMGSADPPEKTDEKLKAKTWK